MLMLMAYLTSVRWGNQTLGLPLKR